ASRFLGPSHDPAWMPDSRSVVFAGQSKWEFHLYQMPVAPVDSLWLSEAADRMRLGPPETRTSEEPAEVYQRKLGLDFASSVVALDPALGQNGGGGMLAFSDVLGAEGYSIALSNSAQSVSSFLDGMEVGVTYFNRAQRMQYGFGVFRLSNTYDVDFDVVR